VAYGPYGARGAAQAYNPRTGAYGSTRQGANVYGSWGTTAVSRGDDWARTSRYTSNITGNTTRVTQGSGGGEAITRTGGPGGPSGVARTGSGDVYAGKDGNVYRKQGDSWQQYGSDGWSSVERATPQGAKPTATGTGAKPTGTAAKPKPATSSWDPSTAQQVTRDSAARAEGAQRTRDAGSVRSGASSRTGSYRASGGRTGGRGR
jgi:hypothetical protein